MYEYIGNPVIFRLEVYINSNDILGIVRVDICTLKGENK